MKGLHLLKQFGERGDGHLPSHIYMSILNFIYACIIWMYAYIHMIKSIFLLKSVSVVCMCVCMCQYLNFCKSNAWMHVYYAY